VKDKDVVLLFPIVDWSIM